MDNTILPDLFFRPIMQSELLTHIGVIHAAGDDTLKFLQTQLTQDLTTLAADEARLAAYCTAKGRMLGQFVVLRHGADVLLLTHASLVDALVKRLSMFVLRLKCKLRNASADYRISGWRGEFAALSAQFGIEFAQRSSEWRVWSTDDRPARLVRWPSAQAPLRLLCIEPAQPIAPAESPAGSGVFWRLDDVLCGLPFIEPENTEAFVPQMVNLDLLGGVSFSKGCYPGQEVVARSHYLGKMKRRMFLGQTAGAAQPGQDVYASTHPGEPAGRIVNAAPMGAGLQAVLFEMSSDDLPGASLHLGTVDGAGIALRDLPYPVSSKSA